MLDIQAVYVRDIAELRGVRFVTMLRVKARSDAEAAAGYGSLVDSNFVSVSRVTLDGYNTKFIKDGLDSLLVAMPQELQERGIQSGAITPLRAIQEIKVFREGTDSDGVLVEIPEVITDLGGAGGSVNHKAPAGSQRVTIDGGILQLTGKDFDKAVAVRVNRQNQNYVVVDKATILCTLPEKASSIDDVEVITSSTKINRTSIFSYLLTDNVNTVSGEAKLVQQFIKVLLTTPGSDHFAPGLGGNMQNFAQQNQPYGSSQALLAMTVINVVNTAAKFAAAQGSSIPPEERLVDAEVLNMGFDPDDPTLLELSLRLNTFAKRQALISVMIGQAQEGLASAASQAPVL